MNETRMINVLEIKYFNGVDFSLPFPRESKNLLENFLLSVFNKTLFGKHF
jgi:hypothetical protein